MKENVLLIADADSDCIEIAVTGAQQSGHAVLRAHSAPEAIKILDVGVSNVNAIVIDVGPGMHGMAVLEAIGGMNEHPPVVVLTDLEETYMRPIVVSHGAAACISKPFTAERLASAIARITGTSQPQPAACDLWGHPSISNTASRHMAGAELVAS